MIVCVAPNPSIDRVLEVKAVEVGRIHRPYRVTAVPGGKGLNAARAAATLGGTVGVVMLAGGHAGRWICEQLVAQEIETACVWQANETRTCFSAVSEQDDSLTEFYEPGSAVTADEWAAFEARLSEMITTDVLVTFSGSLPPGVASDGWARLVRRSVAAGARVVLDTYGEPLRLALREGPTLVKVNAWETTSVTGTPISTPETAVFAAQDLMRQGAEAAIVTLGAEGAVIVDQTGAYRCSAGPRGRYPVGSGDAFLGGVAVALDRGEPLHEAARLGAGAAAANAALPGPGCLDRHIAERYREQVTVLPTNDERPTAWGQAAQGRTAQHHER